MDRIPRPRPASWRSSRAQLPRFESDADERRIPEAEAERLQAVENLLEAAGTGLRGPIEQTDDGLRMLQNEIPRPEQAAHLLRGVLRGKVPQGFFGGGSTRFASGSDLTSDQCRRLWRSDAGEGAKRLAPSQLVAVFERAGQGRFVTCSGKSED